MSENPIMILLYVGIAAYVGKMYWEDYKSQKAEGPNEGALPGALPTKVTTVLIATAGVLLILGIETGGEIALGVASEQSEMAWYMVFAIAAAGIVEEVIFRGYLVVDKKGKVFLIGSIFGFSFLFAVIHPHLWTMEDGFEWAFTAKTIFSTSILFLNSLWFYACRFGPWNKTRSIFPCMVAHALSNLGVFVVKLAQGFVV